MGLSQALPTVEGGKAQEKREITKKRVPGRPFVKGDPRSGRPKGLLNKATVEVRELSRRLLEDPIYQAKFMEDWQARKVHPRIEEMVWAYRYGKPKESVKLELPALAALAKVPKSALLAIARALLAAEDDARALTVEATVVQ